MDDIDDMEVPNPNLRRLVSILSQKTQLIKSDAKLLPEGAAD